MSGQFSDEDLVGLDPSSLALLRELKYSLYSIARRAELGSNGSLEEIQLSAEQTLRMIDTYILSAQTEYGQQQLKLEPIAIGAVMHEAAYALRAWNTDDQTVAIEARASAPVMTNRQALEGMLVAIGRIMGESIKSAKLQMRSFVSKDGHIGVGVFAQDWTISSDELRNALIMNGQAHMPLAKQSSSSGVLLSVADSLARALGGDLEVKRMGRLSGLATTLPRSEQLSLV